MPQTKNFAADIELTERQTENLCKKIKGNVPDGHKIEAIARYAMSELGNGGIVLDAKIYEQIRALAGDITNQQDLVKMIEAGRGRRDGSIDISWRPDPQYVPVLEELARTRGGTAQQIGQDIMDHAVGQGWFYSVTPDTKTCFFSREQAQLIAKWLGKENHFTGQDICDALFAKTKAA